MKQLSCVQALAWIVGSLLLLPGGIYKGVQTFWDSSHSSPSYLCRLVQTGPQREALKTSYLAELVHLSADRPMTLERFDPLLAQKRLCSSPVIKEVQVKVMKPDTVYIDYTVRQPIAWLDDFSNTALDDEGIPFPIVPFFTPKKLPALYLGLETFAWNQPLKTPRLELALRLLKILQSRSLQVRKIDVTRAFHSSLGRREIVVVLDEDGFSKFLRLTPSHYAQELSNYLELRPKLSLEPESIDLRIPHLAFIERISPEESSSN